MDAAQRLTLGTIVLLVVGALVLLPQIVVKPVSPPPAAEDASRFAAYPAPQSRTAPKLAKGKFLVAGRDLDDPNFTETVVLLLDYNEKGALGLVINRETDVRLSELLPGVKTLQTRKDKVFVGGPVAEDSLMVLVRSHEPIEGATFVLRDVYVTASGEFLEKLAAEPGEPRYRAYVGYAGWGAGQLDYEVEMGGWHIVPAQAATVFDPAPAQLWKQLMRGLSMQFARLHLLDAHL